MTRRFLSLVAMLAAVMATALVCQGRVFFRWGAVAQSVRTMESLGGKIAYQAAVNVNGGKGQLTVFGFNEPVSRVVDDLTRAFGMADFTRAGGSMGYGSVTTNGMTLKIVVLRLEPQAQTLVFQIEQTDEDSRRSASPPGGQMLSALPAYPDSEPVFFASDGNAGMSLAISRTPAPEEDVRRSMEGLLNGAGWAPAFPPTSGNGRGPSLGVYLKQQDVCCLLVDASETSPGSRITVLHKERGMK